MMSPVASDFGGRSSFERIAIQSSKLFPCPRPATARPLSFGLTSKLARVMADASQASGVTLSASERIQQIYEMFSNDHDSSATMSSNRRLATPDTSHSTRREREASNNMHHQAFTPISLLISLLLSLAAIRPSDGRCAPGWPRRRSPAARGSFFGAYLSRFASSSACGQFTSPGNERGLDYDERELDDTGYASAGHQVQPSRYPSFVQIRLNFDIEPPACSGVLLSQWHVLTSARCVGDFPQAEGFKQATVHLGAKRRSKSGKLIEPPAYDVDQICPFEKRSRAYDRRLVVLKLANRVKLSEHIQPACLPDSIKQLSMGRVADLVSIGASKIEGAIIAGHEPLRTTLVKRVKCPNYLASLGASLCMRPEGHDGGTCDNDIGAPLIVERAGRQHVVGLVSDHKAICTQEKETSAYADLTSVVDEISQAMDSCSSD